MTVFGVAFLLLNIVLLAASSSAVNFEVTKGFCRENEKLAENIDKSLRRAFYEQSMNISCVSCSELGCNTHPESYHSFYGKPDITAVLVMVGENPRVSLTTFTNDTILQRRNVDGVEDLLGIAYVKTTKGTIVTLGVTCFNNEEKNKSDRWFVTARTKCKSELPAIKTALKPYQDLIDKHMSADAYDILASNMTNC